MDAGKTLGPTKAKNWGWLLPLATAAGLFAVGAVEATVRMGPGWRETGLPLLLAVPFAVGAVLVWRAAPFEQCRLKAVDGGIEVAGRRDSIRLDWAEIAAVTHRPSGFGPGFMTLERRAGAGGREGPRGVMFSVRATGERMEDVLAFLQTAAEGAGYNLREAGATGTGRQRALHAFSGPRRWVPVRV